MGGQDFVQKVSLEGGGSLEVADVKNLLAIAPLHPFGRGDLATNGKQWSHEVATADGEWTEVEKVTVDPGLAEEWDEIEMALTLQLKSSGNGKDCKFKWQAQHVGGTWVDLHTEVTYAANASAYKEYTMSGRFVQETNFKNVPFEIRAVIQREDSGENVTAQCGNSSYISILIF